MFVVVVLFSYSNVVVVVVVFCSHSIFVNEDPQINNLDVNAKNANMEGRDKRWEVELRRGREGMGGDGDWYKIGHFNLTQEPSFFIHKASSQMTRTLMFRVMVSQLTGFNSTQSSQSSQCLNLSNYRLQTIMKHFPVSIPT